MCRPANLNYNLQAPISSAVVEGLTSSLTTAIESVKSAHNSNPTAVTSSSRKHSSRHPHIVVQHHYHDHANELDCIDDRPARGGVTTPFPIRLHKMLDKMEADGHGDVISWQPHGRCFVVRKPKEFKELLPTYFKLSKMSSFQRQLNLYGFQRLTRGRDKNGYYHEYFLRGKPSLSHKITRTKVKGTGVRARSNPGTEPHLWEMTWVGTDGSTTEHHHYSDAHSVSSHEASPKPSPVSAPKKMPQLVSSLTDPASSAAFMPPLSLNTANFAGASLWSQASPAAAMYSQCGTFPPGCTQTEQDIIMSFGGKRFHYLDPEEMVKEATMRKKQQESCRRDDMQSFMSNLELDNLYVQLDDDLVDNDDAFMDMLERVIE